jgi:hypothetical protein
MRTSFARAHAIRGKGVEVLTPRASHGATRRVIAAAEATATVIAAMLVVPGIARADWFTYPGDPNPPQSIVWLVMLPAVIVVPIAAAAALAGLRRMARQTAALHRQSRPDAPNADAGRDQ